MSSLGTIYVGKYVNNKLPKMPPNTKSILIHTSDKNLGGGLSPYKIHKDGMLLENLWQFSKIYPKVYAQRIPLSRFHPDKIIWEHPEEIHVEGGKITESYWNWRKKGFENPFAVRYPNGYHGRKTCLGAYWPDKKGDYIKLDYIEARKKIYCSLYEELAPKHPDFYKLKQILESGKNICIVEVDGPNIEWYTDSPIKDNIEGSVLKVDENMINFLLNDPSHPFGHGYVIAALLSGISFQ